jgi:hypothetical protein
MIINKINVADGRGNTGTIEYDKKEKRFVFHLDRKWFLVKDSDFDVFIETLKKTREILLFNDGKQ